jgi:uncharacterized protein
MASDPLIENLLILQERDVRRDELQHSLDDIPLRLAALDKEIVAARDACQKKLDEQKTLELLRRDLEKRMNEAEEQKIRFLTQQITVKKNDEYAALQKQIEATIALIDKTETEAMETMVKIDEFAKIVKDVKAATDAKIKEVQAKIDNAKGLKSGIETDLAAATAKADEARAKIPHDELATYTYVKTRVKHPPYIVPLSEMRCMGCHLKISNDVVNQAHVTGKITRCDSCGRIVYLER